MFKNGLKPFCTRILSIGLQFFKSTKCYLFTIALIVCKIFWPLSKHLAFLYFAFVFNDIFTIYPQDPKVSYFSNQVCYVILSFSRYCQKKKEVELLFDHRVVPFTLLMVNEAKSCNFCLQVLSASQINI